MRHPVCSVLLLLILICLCACTPDLSILAYQNEALHLFVSFDRGGMEVAGEAMLGKGGEGRDILFTLTSPSMLSGTVYGYENGAYFARTGDTTIPLTECPDILLPFSLFAIPLTAEVTGVEKVDTERVVTLTHEHTIYTLTFSGDNPIPIILTKETPTTRMTLRVTQVVS